MVGQQECVGITVNCRMFVDVNNHSSASLTKMWRYKCDKKLQDSDQPLQDKIKIFVNKNHRKPRNSKTVSLF